MKKAELQALPMLKATPAMMRAAAEDIPQKRTVHRWYYDEVQEVYQYSIFLRCIHKNGILKISLFFPKVMRLGGRSPVYDVFLDKKAFQFLTYDYVGRRWLTGKLDTIDWKETGSYCVPRKHWISKANSKLIKDYLDSEEGGLDAVLRFQRNIRAEELKQRHKRETDKWDNDLAQTPALPKDWTHWVDKVGVREHFIFYDYAKGGATHGYCTYCEKDVPIRNPHYGKEARCPCCRHKVIFKSTGKAGWVKTRTFNAYLMQPCRDGFICREFEVSHTYPKGEYQHPKQYCHEIRRALFDRSGNPLRAYYWGVYKQQYTRWLAGSNCSPSFYAWYRGGEGRVYGKTLPNLAKRGLNRTGVMEYIKQQIVVDPEVYLAVLKDFPQLEQISKASLSALVKECLHNYNGFKDRLNLNEATNLTKMLGINTQELKRLRDNLGGTPYLAWLRYEKAIGRAISDSDITWLCKQKIERSDIQFVANRMSIPQICNYIRRNMRRENMKAKEVITTWADYLSMAARFGMDTSDEIIYRVTKLRQRHDELVERSIDKDIAIQAGNVLLKFPNVEQICQSISEKYEYEAKNYVIRVPTNIEEIIHEGNTLHHCISASDRYWERIENHESYLLFLRKAAEPNTPYYTMEIEPGGTVRQIRTFYDRQEKDIDDARVFLLEWQAVVSKRLTEDDRKKAEQSRDLRVLEFAQMKKDQIRISTGHFAGRLLVEVLTADLMENMAA